MINTTFNKAKSINSLIFIANKIANSNGVADKYTALKLLYFAEIKHLAKYGRLITDDEIANLDHGSTPSKSYDLLKKENNEPSFEILSNKQFKAKVEFDADELSESDLECIISSIEENKGLPFPELKKKAHDSAYNAATQKGLKRVPLDYIFQQENLSEPQISHIKEHYKFVESLKWLNH